MDWQPIETIPNEILNRQIPVLLRGHGIFHGVEFVGVRRTPVWEWQKPEWRTAIGDWQVPDHCITHWMHRPAPPEPENADE